jgi:hypothetical protein
VVKPQNKSQSLRTRRTTRSAFGTAKAKTKCPENACSFVVSLKLNNPWSRGRGISHDERRI